MKTQEEYIELMRLVGVEVRDLINKKTEGGRNAEDGAKLEALKQEMLRLCSNAKADGYKADDLNWRAMLAVRGYKATP